MCRSGTRGSRSQRRRGVAQARTGGGRRDKSEEARVRPDRAAARINGGGRMARIPRTISVIAIVAFIATACSGSATTAPSVGGSSPSTGAGSPATSVAPTSAGSPAAGGTITVTSLWGGSEQEAFQKVLDAFKAKTGITATYEAQRTDYATVLQTRITSGNPPDVSIMPGLGFLRQFARSDGSIKKITDLGLDPDRAGSQLPPGHPRHRQGRRTPVRDHGQVQQQEHVLVSAGQVHGRRRERRPRAGTSSRPSSPRSRPRAVPLRSAWAAKDTWTLTDWFESIYLRQAGRRQVRQAVQRRR